MQAAVIGRRSFTLDGFIDMLEARGWTCESFDDVRGALDAAGFQLHLVSWEGRTAPSDVARLRRAIGIERPLIVILDEDEPDAAVAAYTAGADDVMAPPVHPLLFAARVEALVRRLVRPAAERGPARFGDYSFDGARYRVDGPAGAVTLTPKEFDLAMLLFRHQNRIVSRAFLTTSIWGRTLDVGTRTLEAHLSKLRRKLDLRPENGFQLSAIYGSGYRLERVGEAAPRWPAERAVA